MEKQHLSEHEAEWNHLVLYLRNKVYVGDPLDGEKPYQFSSIKLIKLVDPLTIVPTAKYVLSDHLSKIEQIRKNEVDIFKLDRIFRLANGYFICPPILEIWDETPYCGRPVIVDGGHRIFLAKKHKLPINCIVISEPILCPLPVLPLDGWHQVNIFDQIPVDKRNYNPNIPEPENPYKYYRLDLPGSTGPRSK
ncbi:MAG: hypothetical protein QY322_04665 [bacterium]|nr:MAG: hypothetical protein QY322_04665 [bacterium]